MLRSRLLPALAVSAALALAAPAGAAAALDLDGFATTFPKASALCTKADKGKLPKKLKPSKAKVRKACTKLKQSYSSAHTTFTTVVTPLRQQARDVVTQQRKTCLEARRLRNTALCRQAQIDARAKLAGLRQQMAAAASVAQKAYEAARKTFWATIKKLKGGAGIPADPSITNPPDTGAPTDSELDAG